MTRLTLLTSATSLLLLAATPLFAANTKNILITGYWPPTNEMIRVFSNNPTLNPGGWIGLNWENRGYNVYAYFPTFSNPNCTSCGIGIGDLQVDYQDTSTDFWPIANALQPVAIVSTSRTNANFSWELEMNAYNMSSWTPDYLAPTAPTPNPPDASLPAGALRTSTLPMQNIVDAVNGAGLGLNGFICMIQHAGTFVSGFMAYHGMWYQSLHADPKDLAHCLAAGHIHVGDTIAWDTAHEAMKISLREVMDHLDSILGVPGDVNVDGYVNVDDLLGVINGWGRCPAPPTACPADLAENGFVNVDDLLVVINNWSN